MCQSFHFLALFVVLQNQFKEDYRYKSLVVTLITKNKKNDWQTLTKKKIIFNRHYISLN